MSLKEIKYRYAVDELGNLADVNKIEHENKKAHIYQCLCCKEVLIPAIGKHNQAHFRHKKDSTCNFETYLHQLGKESFKKRFLESDTLYIPNKITEYCKLSDTCEISIDKETFCQRIIEKRINLKSIFDTISIEKNYKGFIADILLEDSKRKVHPLMIEIYVTHQCDQKKIDSGIPIYEIPIADEDSARQILDSDTVYGEKYNFKKIKKASTQPLEADVPIEEFTIYPSGKYYWGIYLKKCSATTLSFPKSALFYCISTNQKEIGLNRFIKIARQENFDLKSCNFCKYYKETYADPYRICTLYKKFQTPHHPNNLCAYGCPYYKEDINTDDNAAENTTNYQIIVSMKEDFASKLKQLKDIFQDKDLNAPKDRERESFLRNKDEKETEELIYQYHWNPVDYENQIISEKENALNFFNDLLSDHDFRLIPSFNNQQKYYSLKDVYDEYESCKTNGKYYIKLQSSQANKVLFIVFVTILEKKQIKVTKGDTPVVFIILNSPGGWRNIECYTKEKIVVLQEKCNSFSYDIHLENSIILLEHYNLTWRHL